MGQAWRSGADRTVERVVVGRRTAEQELDLVRLLEEEAPETERARALPPSPDPAPAPTRAPSHAEIAHAVRDWIDGSIKPTPTRHAKLAAVAALNALGHVLPALGPDGRAEDARLAATVPG